MRLLAVAVTAIPFWLAAALPAAAEGSDDPCRDRPSATAVRGNDLCLAIKTFGAGVPPAARIVAVTGTDDDNTPGALARAYVDSLRQRGVEATYRDAPGAGHGLGDSYWNSGALDAVLHAVKG